MSLFGSKKSSEYILTIALKSSSVDVQLVSVSEKGTREVLFCQRKIILLRDSQDAQAYTKQCLSELSTLLKVSAKDIYQLSKGKLAETNLVLYAPWFTSHIVAIEHKQSAIMSEKFLHSQLNTIKTPAKLVNLEKKIIKLLTNGYEVNATSHSKIDNIVLDVYSSYISESIYKILSDTVRQSIPISKGITYSTSPMMTFEQIRSLLVREDNISYLYIGGEITEVGIIEDDALSFYGTFPIGKHDFLREIQATAMTYDYDLLYQNQVQLKSKAKEAKFSELKAQWAYTALATLTSFKKETPNKLIVISDSKTRDFFVGILAERFKSGQSETFGQYRIINFDMSHLKDIIVYKTPTGANELDLQLEALI